MTVVDERPRRMLIIGTSSTFGVGLPNPAEEAWPVLVQRQLEARHGEVECVRRMFIPDTPTSMQYLEEQIRRYPADWVVVQATAAGLTIRNVPYRIANLFGARAGRIATRLVRNTDQVISPDVAATGGVSHGMRWLARRIVGVDTRTRYRPLVDGYIRAIGRIARLESAATVVIGTGLPHSEVTHDNPRCVDMVSRFNDEVGAAVRARRIPWIDHDYPHTEPAAEHDGTFVDRLHKDAAWHAWVAERVLSAIDPVTAAPQVLTARR